MSHHLAFFEDETVIPPEGSQREGTSVHYLVEVSINDPETRAERGPEELKIANDFLALALNRGVKLIRGLNPISEPEAQKLSKVGSAGTHHDGAVYLVEN